MWGFLSKIAMPRNLIFDMKDHLVVHFKGWAKYASPCGGRGSPEQPEALNITQVSDPAT